MIYKFTKVEVTEALYEYLHTRGMIPIALYDKNKMVNVAYKITSAPKGVFTYELEVTECKDSY